MNFHICIKYLIMMLLPLLFANCHKANEEPNWIEKFSNLTDEELEYARQNWLVAPMQYTNLNDHPSSYMNANHVKPDTQHGVECAACSSAYLLRFYGETVDGVSLYHESTFPCKFEAGAYPKCFKIFFEKQLDNYKTEYYTGSTEDLKNAVSQGVPVIVLLVYEGTEMHYVPVVGYDDEYFYIQDSVEKYRNIADNDSCNERIDMASFDAMWNLPFESCQRLFVIVRNIAE